MKSKLKCICCGKSIKPLYEDSFGLNTDPITDMWDGAGVHEFIVGYGSQYDCSQFLIAICDKCIHKAIIDKRLLWTNENYSKFHK